MSRLRDEGWLITVHEGPVESHRSDNLHRPGDHRWARSPCPPGQADALRDDLARLAVSARPVGQPRQTGNVAVAAGYLTAACGNCQASLDIFEQLAAADPGNSGWQRDLSVSRQKITALKGDDATVNCWK